MAFNSSLHNSLMELVSDSKDLVNQKNHSRLDSLHKFEFDLTPHSEDWKYTTLNWEQRGIYLPVGNNKSSTNWIPRPSSKYYIIIYNGALLMEHSCVWEGVKIQTINRSDDISPNLVNSCICPETYFSSINSGLSEGAQILVTQGTNHPLEIIYAYDSDLPALCQTRIVMKVYENIVLKTIERTIFKQKQNNHISNDVIEVVLKKQSSWTNYLFEEGHEQTTKTQHIRSYYINQEAKSLCEFYDFSFGGGLYRKNMNVFLRDEFAVANLYAISLLFSGHVDHKISLTHAAPNCKSSQVFKGVYGGGSTGVFNGGIIVNQVAQKTDAFQQNNNIIISDRATVHAKPQLEIFADDVSCAHGCTVGQIDTRSLFYIQSRGISERVAKRMLLIAFFNDVTSNIKSEHIKDGVLATLHKLLN